MIWYLINKETKEHYAFYAFNFDRKKYEAMMASGDYLAPVRADPDGWIPWSGGECPLPKYAPCEVRYANGKKSEGGALDSCCNMEQVFWDHDFGNRYNIIAYRPILNDQQESSTMTQEQSITLKPGDYVLTAGMDEDEYHAVAAAFMAAGCSKGEYPEWEDYTKGGYLDSFGWLKHEGLYHGDTIKSDKGKLSGGRKLTIQQVLSATNSGVTPQQETTMHPTDKLAAARKALEAAQHEYDAALAEHRAAYPWLHNDDKPLRDLPPEEWQVGDLVECVDAVSHLYTKGELYQVVRFDGMLVVAENDDNGAGYPAVGTLSAFRFHSRP